MEKKTEFINGFKVTPRGKNALKREAKERRRKEYETMQIMLE